MLNVLKMPIQSLTPFPVAYLLLFAPPIGYCNTLESTAGVSV